MPTTVRTAAESHLRAKALASGTRSEYLSTLRKWETWGGGGPIEELRRKEIREFLDWVDERAVKDDGTEGKRCQEPLFAFSRRKGVTLFAIRPKGTVPDTFSG